MLTDHSSEMKRLHGPDYWFRQSLLHFDPEHINVVTDWRTLDEIRYLREIDDCDLLTVRVHNFTAATPPASEDFERQLDNENVDVFILFRQGDHVAAFPKVSWDEYQLLEI